MSEFLVGIMYHEPVPAALRRRGVIEDDESTAHLYIEADSPNDAMAWGCEIGQALLRHVNADPALDWKALGYSCWLAELEPETSSAQYVNAVQHVRVGQMPDFEQMRAVRSAQKLRQPLKWHHRLWSGVRHLRDIVARELAGAHAPKGSLSFRRSRLPYQPADGREPRSRLQAAAPEHAAILVAAPPDRQREIGWLAARWAVECVGLSHSAIDEALATRELGDVPAAAAALDDHYLDLAETQGTPAGMLQVAFDLARAASAVEFAARGEPIEAVYEAGIATNDWKGLKQIFESASSSQT